MDQAGPSAIAALLNPTWLNKKMTDMDIIKVPSPNFYRGRKIYKPEAIVIHIMLGTLYGTDSWFQSPVSKSSAHYGIGKTGEIHQYVDEKDAAYHAGRVNSPMWSLIKQTENGLYISPDFYTIGIEHEGYCWPHGRMVAKSRAGCNG